MRLVLLVLTVVAVTTLSSCGQKGDLYLPGQPAAHVAS